MCYNRAGASGDGLPCAEWSGAGLSLDRPETSYMQKIESLTSLFFFFSSRRRHTRSLCDWSSDVCSSDLALPQPGKLNDAIGAAGLTDQIVVYAATTLVQNAQRFA